MGKVTTSWLLKFETQKNAGLAMVNKGFEKIDKKVGVFQKKTTNAFNRLGQSGRAFFNNMKGSLGELATQFPIVGQAISFITNPLVLATALIVGLVSILGTATSKAAEFNNEFLELRNLNLDKTKEQIDALNDTVLNLSFAKGFDPQKTSRAFFDIQSATGKFGEEVEQIVSKIGVFSRAVKSDFNESIEGGAKAMGIFQFGAERLDEFLASSFKTVQVGITTFDQLAKSQVEFAGAAAAAGQDFNEANKLFAVFTKTAKSVDIAATLTKTAFQDLTKKSTIAGFKLIGVSLFDTNGEMRKLDDVIGDLAPKLKGLSDIQFAKLKEAIGGSEGIKALLDQVRIAGDDVLGTFKEFDKVKVDMSKLTGNANEDFTILKDIIGQQINVLFIKLGQKILPPIISAMKFFSGLLQGLQGPFSEMSASALAFRIFIEGILVPFRLFVFLVQKVKLVLTGIFLALKFIITDVFNSLKNVAKTAFDFIKNGVKSLFNAIRDTVNRVFVFFGGKGDLFAPLFAGTKRIFARVSAEFKNLVEIAKIAFKVITQTLEGNFGEAEKQFGRLLTRLKTIGSAGVPVPFVNAGFKGPPQRGVGTVLAPGTGEAVDTTAGEAIDAGISDVVGGGARVRNINVTIGSLVENFTIEITESIDQATDEIERTIQEVFIKSVRDSEIALSSD